MLHDPARHEPLTTTPWSDDVAHAGVQRIVADAIARFEPEALWPAHPLDDPKDAIPFCMVYFGAAGVIWALQRLQVAGAADGVPDFAPTVAMLLERNRARLREWEPELPQVPSLLFGDVGILLLQWRNAPSAAVADAIFGSVEANLRNPTLEQLWGSPGTLPAAIHMFEWTGERRWRDLLVAGVTILRDQMELMPDSSAWIWTQDLYGRRVRYLGGGHGFAGNVFPVFRGAHLLPADLVADMAQRTAATLHATAQREAGRANWPAAWPVPEDKPDKKLIQDCHGAPGIICRLPNHAVPALDDLLVEGGELIWHAGPLAKGAGLCHGTAGNGYAFLKLYQRTGDHRWLVRARAFAMHALAQCDAHAARYGQRRYSLWTGDLGVAMYVQSCRAGTDDYPTLDTF